ncbi:MAG TPA: hypothetical protein VM598_02075, partial [Bdellovibrionota bacterium]|nr:hypothetical protein [Bdellovibrionota bacterium]
MRNPTLLAALACALTLATAEAANVCEGLSPRLLVSDSGGRIALSPDGGTVVFDRREGDGCYELYAIDVAGSNERCLTCGRMDVPDNNRGQPAFHPSGRHLVYQAE